MPQGLLGQPPAGRRGGRGPVRPRVTEFRLGQPPAGRRGDGVAVRPRVTERRLGQPPAGRRGGREHVRPSATDLQAGGRRGGHGQSGRRDGWTAPSEGYRANPRTRRTVRRYARSTRSFVVRHGTGNSDRRPEVGSVHVARSAAG